jgi:hypothetical protein
MRFMLRSGEDGSATAPMEFRGERWPTATGCRRRGDMQSGIAAELVAGRFRGPRRDRARRVRSGVSLHSARAGPHGRGERGPPIWSRTMWSGSCVSRWQWDSCRGIRTSARRQHLPGRYDRYRAALHRDAVPPAAVAGRQDSQHRPMGAGRAAFRGEGGGGLGNRTPARHPASRRQTGKHPASQRSRISGSRGSPSIRCRRHSVSTCGRCSSDTAYRSTKCPYPSRRRRRRGSREYPAQTLTPPAPATRFRLPVSTKPAVAGCTGPFMRHSTLSCGCETGHPKWS